MNSTPNSPAPAQNGARPSAPPPGRPASPPPASSAPSAPAARRPGPGGPSSSPVASFDAAPQQLPADYFQISSGRALGAQRCVLYGPGGIGKSSLAALMPGKNLFIDLEGGTNELDVKRIGRDRVPTFAHFRALLMSPIVSAFDNIHIDTGTKLEELALAHTLATVKHEKTGQLVSSIEGYGFGKGYQHVYDTFMLALADIDRLVERGKNVTLICHDCVADVPNPAGDDFIRYEPHLQAPKSGRASIRNRVVQWADHVLFVAYDVNVTKEGKGQGGGTRTVYTAERPTHIAKSRRLGGEPVLYEHAGDDTIWQHLFAKTEVQS